LFAEGEGGGDELFERAVEIVQRDRKASTSYLQRRLQIGYNRAASSRKPTPPVSAISSST
jgi:S-DNA-T family DNA segregation ATPase FtsK/SpoIIIE